MEALKIVDLEPNTTYTVTQWTLKQSKYGDRLLIKAHKDGGTPVLFWSNALLFNELLSISDNKVNFSKLLNISYTFQIVGYGEYQGHKTVQLTTNLD